MKKLVFLVVGLATVLMSFSSFAVEAKRSQIAYRPYRIEVADMSYATGFWGIIPPKSNANTWWTWIQMLPSDESVADDLARLDKDKIYNCMVSGWDTLSSSKPPVTVTQIVYRIYDCQAQ